MSNLVKKVTSAMLTSAVVLSAVSSVAWVNAAYTNLEAANKLANLGVIVDQSTNPSAYRLADSIQRKEALKIMMKLSGQTVSDGSCVSPFADIANTDWACKYAVAALNSGFIAPNTNYRPNDQVSKIEGLKMVMQARGIAKGPDADWRAGYVSVAVANNVAMPFSDYDTSVERGLMFVWAAELAAPMAVTPTAPSTPAPAEDDTDDLLGALLGGLDDDEDTTPTPTTPSTPVVTTPEPTTPVAPVTSGSDVLMVSLNPETPSDGLAQANTSRVPLLVFDVKAGSEDVTLDEATFEFIGLGDFNLLDNVSIYNQIGEKVSKTKSFSELTREISFDNDVVVEAGTTMTLTVAGQITDPNGVINATFGIQLVDLQTSSDVEGENLVGALLVPALFSNVASLEVKEDKATGDVSIGDNMKLAWFEIEEKNDNEDVMIKTITIHVSGSIDEDDISDLSIHIDGTEVASNLMVNSDEEIVAAVDYEMAADDKVSVELMWTISGSVGETVDFSFMSNDDIYSIGARSGMPVAISNAISTEDIASLNTIEGAEINVAFDTSDVDEAKPDAEDVLVWTLRMTAMSEDYEVTRLAVKVWWNGQLGIDDLELDGSSFDAGPTAVSVSGVTYQMYYFDDISLPQGEEVALDLTMDVQDNTAYNNTSMTFEIMFVEIEDDMNDVTYVAGSANSWFDVDDILSTTALNTQTIDIESAWITISNVQVNDRQLVLGNGIETVIYKWKISVSDSEDVIIEDMDFSAATTNSLSGEDFDDVVANATLNIGGQTFDWDVEAASIDFSNINAVIPAGSDNIEVLVTAILKDNSAITGAGNYLALMVDTSALSLEDTDGEDILAANITSSAINSKPTKTELLDRGTFAVNMVQNGDLEDEIEETVLAWTTDVAIGEVEIQAQYEAVDVDELTFKITGADFSDSLLNVNLVAEDGSIIASDAVVNLVWSDTEIVFEDFTVENTDDEISALLVAELRAYDTTGDVTKGQLGSLAVSVVAPASTDLEGESSNDPITPMVTVPAVIGETVTIVPAIVTVAVGDTLGNNDKYATIDFTVDKGNNEFDNDDIVITQIAIENAIAAPWIIVRNDDNVTVVNNDTTTTLLLNDATASDYEINNGDSFEFKVGEPTTAGGNTELRILANGVSYTLDNNTYTTNNDDIINLGEYDDN